MRTRRIRAVAAFAWLGLALASNARAADLRDWGRKHDTASERFLVLMPSVRGARNPGPGTGR